MDSSDKAIRTNDRKSNTSREPESLFPANPSSTLSPNLARPSKEANRRQASKIFDDHSTTAGYESVPLIDIDTLPRGGISFETKAVGRIQVGFYSYYFQFFTTTTETATVHNRYFISYEYVVNMM